MKLLARCLQLIMTAICGGLTLSAALAENLDSVEKNGISVGFNIQSLNHSKDNRLRAGEHVSVQFKVKDGNQTPLSGLFPAAWIHPSSPDDEGAEDICINKAKAFIGGSLLSRAELDLNVYYVLALNQDASISVVDPLFGFGGSKLLTMLPLNGIGYDWVLPQSQEQVFVSVPEANEITEINTANWQVTHHASDGQWQNPTTISVQPDQQYLWALVNNGVSVFNQQPFTLQKNISLPKTPIALTFSSDSRLAYAMSQQTLDIIDTHALKVVKSIELGDQPISMDYSSQAEELYISHSGSGEVWVVDGREHDVAQVITSEPGIGMLRFTPDGRWGLLVNPLTDRLSIIDAAKQKIVQSGLVEGQPEYIAFSDNLAYIRHADSFNLYMITLDDQDLGREGAEIPAVDTPGGDSPAGLIDIPSGSDGIVQAPGSNAVLVSNYRDKAVYFYKEGMAAPMGQFNNYGKSPRAVLAVDHSLKERNNAGVYSTSTLLPKAGNYQAVYFMDSPRIVHCFSFNIEPPTDIAAAQPTNKLVVTSSRSDHHFKVGKTAQLSFHIDPQNTDRPMSSQQFEAAIVLASGLWRQRLTANLNPDKQLMLEFTPPLPGSYAVHLSQINGQGSLSQQTFNYDVSP